MSIPSWIQSFNPIVYESLSKNLSWISSNKAELLPEFNLLLNKLTSWSQLNREPILVDLLHQLSGYISITKIYDINPSVNLSAYSIFNLENLALFPEDYLDSAEKIREMISIVPPTITLEEHASQDLQGSVSSSIRRISLDILMGHLSPVTSIDRSQILKILFENYNYQNVFLGLNVGSLKLPS